MQASTTERPATSPKPPGVTLPPRFTRMFAGGRIYVWLLLVSLGLGALTLLYPSTPSYDPWSWLLWGRQIIHGTLDLTATGSSWKPLPMIFTTVVALFGSAAPNLWLMVARAGFFLTLLLSFKLTWRMTRALVANLPGSTGGESASALLSRLAAIGPPLLASSIVFLGVALTHTFPGDSLLGYSESVATAAMLIAVERAVDGHHRQAFALGMIVALDRPEAWVFWGPYGLWLMWKDPGARVLVIGLGVLMLMLWFVPTQLGGRSAALTALHNHAKNSAVNSSFPFLTELKDVETSLVLSRVKILGLGAIVASAWILWQRRAKGVSWRRWRPAGGYEKTLLAILVTGVFGYAWWVIIAIETQIGFPGNPRYSVFGSIPEYFVGAIGFSWVAVVLAREAGRRLAARNRKMSWEMRVTVATALLTLLFVFGPNYVGNSMMPVSGLLDEQQYQSQLRTRYEQFIKASGGPAAVLRCGSIVADNFQVPMLAWYLGVHTKRIDAGTLASPDRPANVIFQDSPGSVGDLSPTDDIVALWMQRGYKYEMTFTFPVNFYKDCRK